MTTSHRAPIPSPSPSARWPRIAQLAGVVVALVLLGAVVSVWHDARRQERAASWADCRQTAFEASLAQRIRTTDQLIAVLQRGNLAIARAETAAEVAVARRDLDARLVDVAAVRADVEAASNPEVRCGPKP